MDPVPIPGPAPLPLIGNIRDVDAKDAIGSLGRLAETYGIFASLLPLLAPMI